MKIVPNRVISCFLLFANGVFYAQDSPGPPPPTPPPPPGSPIDGFVWLLMAMGIGFAFLTFRKLQLKK